jgi:hypothetical protein
MKDKKYHGAMTGEKGSGYCVSGEPVGQGGNWSHSHMKSPT